MSLKSKVCVCISLLLPIPCLHAQANSWTRLSVGGTVSLRPRRQDHTIVWSSEADGLFLFGGSQGYSDVVQYNNLSFWSRQNGEWLAMNENGPVPTARSMHSAVWSVEDDGMYIFGGEVDGWRSSDELYFWSRQCNSWSLVPGIGDIPEGRHSHSAVWSREADGMYIWGGNAHVLDLDTLCFWSRQTRSWTLLGASGTEPLGRKAHVAVWSSEVDGMYIFGGYRYSLRVSYNDLWLWSRASNTWSEVRDSTGDIPAARHYFSGVWSTGADGFYIFSGQGTGVYNYLHLWSRQTNSWSKLDPASGSLPSGRWGHSAAWSDELSGMYIYGGSYGADELHFWQSQTTTASTSSFMSTSSASITCMSSSSSTSTSSSTTTTSSSSMPVVALMEPLPPSAATRSLVLVVVGGTVHSAFCVCIVILGLWRFRQRGRPEKRPEKDETGENCSSVVGKEDDCERSTKARTSSGTCTGGEVIGERTLQL